MIRVFTFDFNFHVSISEKRIGIYNLQKKSFFVRNFIVANISVEENSLLVFCLKHRKQSVNTTDVAYMS